MRQAGEWPVAVDQTLRMIVKYGPSLAGVIMACVVGRLAGLREMLQRLVSFRVKAWWYLFALLMPLAVLGIALPVRAVLGDGVLATVNVSVPGSVGIFLAFVAARFFAGGGLGEELGWRGFMLPRLQSRVGALNASVIIGVFHGAWHLPGYGLAATLFLTVFTVAAAIVFTWMYNHTAGNLFLAALLHASGNASLQFFEVIVPALDNDALFVLLSFALWVVIAGILVRRLDTARNASGLAP